MTNDLQLYTSASVTLNGSGNGQVSIGPGLARERWEVTSVAVQVSTAVTEAQCALHLGVGPQAVQFLGRTGTGSSGDSYGTGGITLQPGQSFVAVWTGGDAGATATLNVYGVTKRP